MVEKWWRKAFRPWPVGGRVGGSALAEIPEMPEIRWTTDGRVLGIRYAPKAP
jgi:hypothetical protein